MYLFIHLLHFIRQIDLLQWHSSIFLERKVTSKIVAKLLFKDLIWNLDLNSISLNNLLDSTSRMIFIFCGSHSLIWKHVGKADTWGWMRVISIPRLWITKGLACLHLLISNNYKNLFFSPPTLLPLSLGGGCPCLVPWFDSLMLYGWPLFHREHCRPPLSDFGTEWVLQGGQQGTTERKTRRARTGAVICKSNEGCNLAWQNNVTQLV